MVGRLLLCACAVVLSSAVPVAVIVDSDDIVQASPPPRQPALADLIPDDDAEDDEVLVVPVEIEVGDGPVPEDRLIRSRAVAKRAGGPVIHPKGGRFGRVKPLPRFLKSTSFGGFPRFAQPSRGRSLRRRRRRSDDNDEADDGDVELWRTVLVRV